ncbi:uncharacterized protein B0T23DRAFT_306357 [Neurospora hispaniola]|uniref:Uncharacterized protein n=1 Tax=Neurospora hispaniola TaxID=588809 RepID=A0AAJ0MV43_9PEZI|nr:hypothetical protein B0T23DRAFT_306357 [Neurospora hispaniola]
MCTTTVTIADADGFSNLPSEDASISLVKKVPARKLHCFRPTSCHFSSCCTRQRWLEPKALSSCRWHFEQEEQDMEKENAAYVVNCLHLGSLSSHRVANLAMSPPPSAADYPAHQSRAVTGPTFNDI